MTASSRQISFHSFKIKDPKCFTTYFRILKSLRLERSSKALKWKGMKSLNSQHSPTGEKANDFTRERGAVTNCH